MNKKAQGLPLNTIIIAILAIIVLIVLIMIFTGRIGKFGKGITEVEQEKTCPMIVSIYESCPEGYEASFGRYKDLKPNQQCCEQAQSAVK